MKTFILLGPWLLLIGAAAPQAKAPAQEPTVKIEVTSSIEEGKPVLVAKLTRDGKAVEGAIILFQAERLFGWLALGRETTLDDGTAAVPFPKGLPGGPTGQLRIRAKIEAPPDLASLTGEALLGGGLAVSHDREAFPRALWSPHAPLALIIAIFLLLGSVWSTYGYVLFRLLRISRGTPV